MCGISCKCKENDIALVIKTLLVPVIEYNQKCVRFHISSRFVRFTTQKQSGTTAKLLDLIQSDLEYMGNCNLIIPSALKGDVYDFTKYAGGYLDPSKVIKHPDQTADDVVKSYFIEEYLEECSFDPDAEYLFIHGFSLFEKTPILDWLNRLELSPEVVVVGID